MPKKLLYSDKSHHEQGLVIPIDGRISFETDGSVIVSDEAAEVLLTIPGWSDPEQPLDLEEDSNEEGNAEETEEEGKSGGASLEDLDLDQLDKCTVAELKEIAIVAKVKDWEKFTKNKKVLATYLKSKLKKIK